MNDKVRHCSDKECETEYKFGRVLGQGAFALVKLAESRDDKSKWAIKIIKKDSLATADADSLKNEMNIVLAVSHTNIVETREVIETPHYVFVVMECMSGGELFDRIVEKDHYSEIEAKEAFWQMVSAIKHCHDNGVVHRDLKPENLLYSDASENAALKLADFGLGQILKPNEMMHHACGTPGYIAPEMLTGEKYGSTCDMWSLGVILYILICGFPPFYNEDEQELFKSIRRGEYEFLDEYWGDASDSVKDLISKLLVVNPQKRMTAAQVFEHDWLSEDFAHKTSHKFVKLNSCLQQMKLYNARRRLKVAVRAVLASNKIKMLTGFAGKAKAKAKAQQEKEEAGVAEAPRPAEAPQPAAEAAAE